MGIEVAIEPESKGGEFPAKGIDGGEFDGRSGYRRPVGDYRAGTDCVARYLAGILDVDGSSTLTDL